MKNKQNTTLSEQLQNLIEKSQKEEKLILLTWPLTFLYWYRHWNKKWRGLVSFLGPNLPIKIVGFTTTCAKNVYHQ